MKKIFTKSVCMALLVFFAWSLNAQDLTMKAALQGKSQVVQQMPQVPLDATLYSEPGGGYRGPGDVALSYGFDDCTPVTFTNGWTANPSPTGTAIISGTWCSVYGVNFGTFQIMAYSGVCAVIITYYTGAPAHNSWLFSNAVNLVGGTEYEISFMAYMGYFGANDYDKLRVRIGDTPSEAGMELTVFESGSTQSDFMAWKKFTATFTAPTTKTYYFGFQCFTDEGKGNYIFLDNVLVKEPANNDLAVIGKRPPTKLPVSQQLTGLSAKAYNQGANTQTGIVLTATLGTNTIGTASLASLAPGVTSADMDITNPVTVLLGNNTVTYTLTQNESEDTPNDNTVSYTVEGTATEFAKDNGDFTASAATAIGHTAAISFGNTFTITDATKINGAKLGYANWYPSNASSFTMSIYKMNPAGTALVTPALHTTAAQTKPSTANATGWIDVAFPDIELEPGTYFLCANQTGTTQIGLCATGEEGVLGYYILGTAFGNLNTAFGSTIGAPFIRMIIEEPTSNCPPPSNLTATYTNDCKALLSWDEPSGKGRTIVPEWDNNSYEKLAVLDYAISATRTKGIPQKTALQEPTNNNDGPLRGTFTEDVETHPNFTINSTLNGWSYIDGDGDDTYGLTGITFPGAYSPMAYIVFNPSATSPATGNAAAHSGQKYFASFAATTMANNDWIISPQLTEPSSFSFWAKSYTAQYGLERMKVGYSTTGKLQSDFTFLTASPYVEVPATAWTQYTYSIPSNAKYVAVNCVSDDAFFFMLDDITIVQEGEFEFITYNVYRDGDPVATEIFATSFTDEGFSATEGHTWEVKAVCGSGEESVGITVTKDPCVDLNVCNPPNNLVVTYTEGCDAELTWTHPNTKWIKYCVNDAVAGQIGYSSTSGENMTAAIRFTPTDLAMMGVQSGFPITKIALGIGSDMAYVNSMEIRIWEGGSSITDAGTLVYSQPVTGYASFAPSAMAEITLTTPFVIDATKELRIGWNLVNTQGYPFGRDTGPNFAGKGLLFLCPALNGGQWMDAAPQYTWNYNWAIKAFVDGGASQIALFNVYRDDAPIATNVNTTSYTDTGFDPTLEYTWAVATICGAEESELAEAFMKACDRPCEEIITGTGTVGVYQYPINCYYGCSYVQEIFTPGQLGNLTEDKMVTSLKFKHTLAATITKPDVKIYLGLTDKVAFAGQTQADWVPSADLQLVYSGTVVLTPNGEIEIPFQNNFKYKKGKNLVVAFLSHNASVYYNLTNRYEATATGTDYTTLHYYADGVTININSPQTPNGRAQNHNNFTFEFCNIPPVCDDYPIGTGTTNAYTIPINTFYGYSYTQQIFDADEIGGFIGNQTKINSVSFQYIYNTGQVKSNQTVYLGNTSKSTYTGTTDWISLSELTPVYIGDVDYNDSETWVTIEFDEPFTYTGENLVVAVLNNHGSYSTSSNPTFRVHSTTGFNKTLRYDKDNTPAGPIDPNALPTSGGTYNYTSQVRNNIQFNICGFPAEVDMQAMSIAGAAMVSEGETQNYTVTVKNNGDLPAKNFTVKILNEANTQLATQVVATPLPAGETTTVTLPITFNTPGVWNLKGRVEIAKDIEPDNDETALFTVMVIDKCLDMDVVSDCNQIGTGTTTTTSVPFYFYYNSSMSQSIYLANEICIEPGTIISGLSYRYVATSAISNQPIKVYLANTTQNNFASTSAWIPFNQFTQVYSGTASVPTGAYEMVITFDVPFIYTGGNLCIMPERTLNPASYVNNVLAQVTSQTPTNRTLYYYSDSAPFTPNAPQSGTQSSNVPNMILHYFSDMKTFPLNDGNILGEGAVITLDPIECGENGTAYFSTDNSCYYIDDVIIGGVHWGDISSYTFTNVIAPLPVIEVVTKAFEYEIIATHGENGTIDPIGIVPVECGTNQIFIMKPDQGYTVASITVDGVDIPNPTRRYTFVDIQANHTIHVEFMEFPQRNICFTIEGEGTVYQKFDGDDYEIEDGCISVDSGSMQHFTFTPAPHYTLQAVYVNGVLNMGATISGSIVFPSVKFDQNIKVVFKIDEYIIHASAGVHGGIAPSGNVSVPYNGNQQFDFIPAQGYVIDQVFVDNEEKPEAAEDGYYIFENVNTNHTIYVTFKRETIRMYLSWTDGGGIIEPVGYTYTMITSNSSYVDVSYNDIMVVQFYPNVDAGYHTIMVEPDGVSYPPAVQTGSYTFYYIIQPHTLHVTFEKYTYPIAAQIDAHGMIDPEGTTYVEHGGMLHYEFYAMEGYKLANVFVDGEDKFTAVASGYYTFTNVTAPHTIDVLTTPLVFNINSYAEEGGYITPEGNVSVTYGGNQAYTFAALPGYEIDEVRIDGLNNMEAILSGAYAFMNVKTDHTIKVTFKMSKYRINAMVDGQGGFIDPMGITEITYFDNITYTITPDDGYQISKVLVNGDNLGAIETFTFSEVLADGSIEAFFDKVIIINPDGIDELANSIAIYSHSNIVYIINDNKLPISNVSIMDMYGRVVWTGVPQGNTIELNVATGIYTVRVTADSKFTTKKVNIQR